MTPQSDDLAIQRAAGIIMHHLERGKPDDEAIARAEEREPQLSQSEIRAAYEWALAAIRFAELCKDAPREATMAQLMDAAGLPWRR